MFKTTGALLENGLNVTKLGYISATNGVSRQPFASQARKRLGQANAEKKEAVAEAEKAAAKEGKRAAAQEAKSRLLSEKRREMAEKKAECLAKGYYWNEKLGHCNKNPPKKKKLTWFVELPQMF